MSPRSATLIGLTAILMWSLLSVGMGAIAAVLIATGGLIAARDMIGQQITA